MTEQNVERRKYPRFKSLFPISFQLFSGDTRYSDSQPLEAIATGIRGVVGNVSFEGLYVEANPTKEQLSELMGMNENPELFFIEIETELIGQNHVAWIISLLESNIYLYNSKTESSAVACGIQDAIATLNWKQNCRLPIETESPSNSLIFSDTVSISNPLRGDARHGLRGFDLHSISGEPGDSG